MFICVSGLVHKSEMSACRVDNPSEIVDVGEQVWIKVIGTEVHSVITPIYQQIDTIFDMQQ